MTSLPIELTCSTSGVVSAWRVNGRVYTIGDVTNGELPEHTRTGKSILINSPVNNTEYICVSVNVDGNEINSDPVHIFFAGEYDTYVDMSNI